MDFFDGLRILRSDLSYRENVTNLVKNILGKIYCPYKYIYNKDKGGCKSNVCLFNHDKK